MIKVIVFDYAEVVAEGPMARWSRKNLDPNTEKYKAYKKHSEKWDLGEYSLNKTYQIIGDITGNKPYEVWEKFFENSKPNHELIDLIKVLRSNYKIILYSNFASKILRKLLRKNNLFELFDEIIISSEHKLKKPDPNFFELLVRKSNVNKSEIIFTDDKVENVNAANKYGIRSFVFTTTQNLIEDLKKENVKI